MERALACGRFPRAILGGRYVSEACVGTATTLFALALVLAGCGGEGRLRSEFPPRGGVDAATRDAGVAPGASYELTGTRGTARRPRALQATRITSPTTPTSVATSAAPRPPTRSATTPTRASDRLSERVEAELPPRVARRRSERPQIWRASSPVDDRLVFFRGRAGGRGRCGAVESSRRPRGPRPGRVEGACRRGRRAEPVWDPTSLDAARGLGQLEEVRSARPPGRWLVAGLPVSRASIGAACRCPDQVGRTSTPARDAAAGPRADAADAKGVAGATALAAHEYAQSRVSSGRFDADEDGMAVERFSRATLHRRPVSDYLDGRVRQDVASSATRPGARGRALGGEIEWSTAPARRTLSSCFSSSRPPAGMVGTAPRSAAPPATPSSSARSRGLRVTGAAGASLPRGTGRAAAAPAPLAATQLLLQGGLRTKAASSPRVGSGLRLIDRFHADPALEWMTPAPIDQELFTASGPTAAS